MNKYWVTPSKKLSDSGYKERIIEAKTPKEAVEIYAKEAGMAFKSVQKLTNKVLKELDVNFFNMNDYIDFAVSGETISLNSGGVYRLIN